jgi:AAA domain/Relaxase/Mobilisation nuclease domain
MIPNIVKGKGITGALAYAMGQGNDAQTGERLELGEGEKSRATLLGGQNFGFEIDTPERLELARRVMEWQGLPENQGSRTRKQERDCFHASLSWEPGQEPSQDEMRLAGRDFLRAVGLEKARAVFIAHNDTDHRHIHIVASRIDPETGKTLWINNDYIEGQKWAVEWDREHGPERGPDGPDRPLAMLIKAVQAQNADAVLSYLTRDKATFQAWEVNRALQYGGLEGEPRDTFRDQILTHKNTIGLRETQDGGVTRYTTREALADELSLQRSALQLAKDARHGIDAAHIEKASKEFTLKPEQDAALRHLTGAEGFSMLWGEAGTGKSHTLNAVRSAYERAGKTVIGLAPTNIVAQQMHSDGFKLAGTIDSQLLAFENGNGRGGWTRDTVVIVDEAAMVSTENLARLATAAKQKGAKLILAGDDRQLSSIERGGMFETLRQTHGAAILTEVQRVKDPEQQAAFNQMHKGSFADALKTFEKLGGVHWTKRQSDTLREMAARYTSDIVAEPDKKRFMFAHTNKDVATLNQHARTLHQARGDLGIDQTLFTKDGPAIFAEGDRIQFTGSARKPAEKRAGLTNGRVGTIEKITFDKQRKARVTVALDVGANDKPQSVTFTVGDDARAGEFDKFKLGYAGTIYRGQGRTLDQAYVAHTAQWRSSAAYVALTRHREQVHIFAARETVKDLDAMAKGLARSDNKRAATAYRIDTGDIIDLEKAVLALEDRGTSPAARAAALPSRAVPAGKSERPAERNTPVRGTARIVGGTARIVEGIAAPIAFRGLGKALGFMSTALAALMGAPDTPAPVRAKDNPNPPNAELETRRSKLLRDYGEEIPDERLRDAEIARDRGRERRRGE